MDLSLYPNGADLSNIPALSPPAGIMSNFIDPANRANITIIPCAGIVAVMILFVFLRMYTKIYITGSTGWDDCESAPFQSVCSRADSGAIDICIFVTVRVSQKRISIPKILISRQLFSVAYLGLLVDSKSDLVHRTLRLNIVVYQRGFGVHQWDISVARLNSLLAKVR